MNGIYEFHRQLAKWDYSEFEQTKELFRKSNYPEEVPKFIERNINFVVGTFGHGFDGTFDFESIIWSLEGEGSENAILKK